MISRLKIKGDEESKRLRQLNTSCKSMRTRKCKEILRKETVEDIGGSSEEKNGHSSEIKKNRQI